jgi:hypothetical protein
MLECAPAINNARARASFARFREIIRSLLRFPFVTARRPLKNPRARQSAIANRAAERICSDVLHAQRTALALFPRKIILSLPLSLSLSLSLFPSPQMFTSISWRIFEEARSKRVWSISSTFEYAPPFPPRAALSFFPFPFPFLSLFLCFSGST